MCIRDRMCTARCGKLHSLVKIQWREKRRERRRERERKERERERRREKERERREREREQAKGLTAMLTTSGQCF